MLLRNQLYAGIVDVPEYGVRRKRGDFEPLIAEDLFYRAQAVLSGAEAAGAPRFPSTRVRAVRILRTRPLWQLVKRPKRVLRLLPLPPWLPSGERDQGEA